MFSPQIQPGSRVTLHVRLSLADGTVVEDTFAEAPLEFVVGDGTLIPALELALYGMRAGQEQRLSLTAGQAFGEREPDNVQVMARADFPADIPLEPGVVVGFATPAGEEMPGTVLAVEQDRVRVDFNHPLAGRPIIFEVQVVDVEMPVMTEQGEDA